MKFTSFQKAFGGITRPYWAKIFVFITLLMLHPVAALANKVALVIGNSNYASVAPLANPRNDSAAVATALAAQGFEVIKGDDLTRSQMYDALREFRTLADQSNIALVYYAGHGIEVAGQNYLIPVDAELADERDASLEMINVSVVLRQISAAGIMKMVVLDACRNNPFVARMTRGDSGRNVGSGLANIESTEADTLIAYAAAAGEITPDGKQGGNSPFTKAFVDALAGPPKDVRQLLGRVRDDMRLTVPGAAPFVYSSLGGRNYVINPNSPKPSSLQRIAPATPTETVAAPAAAVAPAAGAILADYAKADRLATLQGWDAFLSSYHAQNYHLLYGLGLEKRDALRGQAASQALAVTGFTPTAPTATATADGPLYITPATPAMAPILTAAQNSMTLTEAKRAFQVLLSDRGCYRGGIDGVIGRGSLTGLATFSDLAGQAIPLSQGPDKADLLQAIGILQSHPNINCPTLPPRRATRTRRASSTPTAQPDGTVTIIVDIDRTDDSRFINSPSYCPQLGASDADMRTCLLR